MDEIIYTVWKVLYYYIPRFSGRNGSQEKYVWMYGNQIIEKITKKENMALSSTVVLQLQFKRKLQPDKRTNTKSNLFYKVVFHSIAIVPSQAFILRPRIKPHFNWTQYKQSDSIHPLYYILNGQWKSKRHSESPTIHNASSWKFWKLGLQFRMTKALLLSNLFSLTCCSSQTKIKFKSNLQIFMKYQ